MKVEPQHEAIIAIPLENLKSEVLPFDYDTYSRRWSRQPMWEWEEQVMEMDNNYMENIYPYEEAHWNWVYLEQVYLREVDSFWTIFSMHRSRGLDVFTKEYMDEYYIRHFHSWRH